MKTAFRYSDFVRQIKGNRENSWPPSTGDCCFLHLGENSYRQSARAMLSSARLFAEANPGVLQTGKRTVQSCCHRGAPLSRLGWALPFHRATAAVAALSMMTDEPSGGPTVSRTLPPVNWHGGASWRALTGQHTGQAICCRQTTLTVNSIAYRQSVSWCCCLWNVAAFNLPGQRFA